MANDQIATQVRLPAALHAYIQTEAARMGIAQNAFLILLLEQGKKLWTSPISIHQQL